jgi:hypothetical protein
MEGKGHNSKKNNIEFVNDKKEEEKLDFLKSSPFKRCQKNQKHF